MAGSQRAHAKEYFPELLLPVSLSPQWATATPASAGDPPTLAGRSGSVSCGVTTPSPWVLMCTLQSGVSVSPSPVEVLQSNPTSLQSLILWEFLLLLPNPQIGTPDVGLRTFTPVGVLLWYNCSPVCESPTQQLRDLIFLWLRLSYHLIAASPLSLYMGYFFWWVPVFLCQWLFSS